MNTHTPVFSGYSSVLTLPRASLTELQQLGMLRQTLNIQKRVRNQKETLDDSFPSGEWITETQGGAWVAPEEELPVNLLYDTVGKALGGEKGRF